MNRQRIGLIALAVNFLLSVALAWYLTRIGYAATHAGLAFAISVAALLNAFLLYRGLSREGVIEHGSGWLPLLLRVSVANVAMCAVLSILALPLSWWLSATLTDRVLQLTIHVAAGLATYVGSLFIIGMRPSQLGMRPH